MRRLHIKAKKYRGTAKLDLADTSIDQLLNLDIRDIERMSEKNQKRILSKLASAGNKRIKRLRESDVDKASGALRFIEDSGGTFTAKQKGKKAISEELLRVRGFLKAKTSTIKGTKKSVEKISKKLKKRIGETYKDPTTGERVKRELFTEKGTANREAQNRFWDLYHKMREKASALYSREGSAKAEKRLANYLEEHEGESDEEILNGFEDYLRDIYEAEEEIDEGLQDEEWEGTDIYS